MKNSSDKGHVNTRHVMHPSYLAQPMQGLHKNRQKLHGIKTAYDNLALLGQLLCTGTDTTGMRPNFNERPGVLPSQLTREFRKKAIPGIGSNARVAIDLLLCNPFERAADNGFLATDRDIRSFAEAVEQDPDLAADKDRVSAVHARFTENVRKYSVYELAAHPKYRIFTTRMSTQ
ncbi:hypothetical protein [Sulfuriferula multivorans]|uniref:hypothetical protein n=1 Tax=Sulfuriferula multivorans TaxID=1559896 RepID=UPI001CB8B559|nr:hypothetical protein [Sulfuriferula multivorans]